MQNNDKPSVSIIVPAYKEAANLESTVKTILKSAEGLFSDYEILIIDCLDKEGRDDGTREIADELAKNNSKICAVHNNFMNLGAKYWQGVDLAKYEYTTWIPGDNETSSETVKKIFQSAGKSDVVCSYTTNPEVRPFKIRIFSRLYTIVVNTLFGLNLRYFNGVNVYKTALLKSLPESAKKNTAFSYNAEILVRLIKNGSKYIEIPQIIMKKEHKKTNFLSFGYFIPRYAPLNTIKRILKLFWEVEIRNKI
jgi:glycosyltransferase involved in cell wall biosynthesis